MRTFIWVFATLLLTSFLWYYILRTVQRADAMNRWSDVDAPMAAIIIDLDETAQSNEFALTKRKIKLLRKRFMEYYEQKQRRISFKEEIIGLQIDDAKQASEP